MVIVLLTVAAFRHGLAVPPPIRLAIRAGLLALVGAQIAGAVMIVTGMRLVFGGHPQLAYATGGWLKPVHAVLMHGILMLPLLAWLVSKLGWNERMQSRAMWTGVALYAVVIVVAALLSVSFA
jgi:hypothetical protein